MNKEAQQLLLRNFFSAYFHEDWPCEADSPESVFTGYAQSSSPHERRMLAEAILEYSRAFADDKELEESLCRDLGCYYLPSADGLSAKGWLEHAANGLLRASLT